MGSIVCFNVCVRKYCYEEERERERDSDSESELSYEDFSIHDGYTDAISVSPEFSFFYGMISD
jgi:hypothetical protein